MKRCILVAVLTILASGCFAPSPGGLQGQWNLGRQYPGMGYSIDETVSITFNGKNINRVLEQDFRANDGNRVVLRVADIGTFTVDSSVSPAQLSITDLTRTDYPTSTDFAVAAAIVSGTTTAIRDGLDETAGLTFQAKSVYAKEGSTLRIKFGDSVNFPPSLSPPFVYELEKAFKLFAL